MRWQPKMQVLPSGVMRIGPMVSTPAGSEGMSWRKGVRFPVSMLSTETRAGSSPRR